MANSIYEATGDGSTTDFTIPYTYLEADDVTAFVGGVSTSFTFTSSNVVTFASAPANGVTVRIVRNTDLDNLNVTYSDGGALTAQQLNNSNNQLLFGVQEAIDRANESIAVAADGKFDAQTRGIKNVATPTNANDATNKSYVDTSANNAASSAAAALVSQNAAASSATAAANSATASAASATTSANEATDSANSATASANSAATASTQAALATTNGAAQVALATTQANNAASSASTASTQASNASTSASTSTTQATNSANSATASANSATAAAGSASTASTQAALATTNGAAQVALATTQANNAATSATAAANSATAASTSETNAANSAAAAAAAFDNFDDTYLGSKTSDPTVDNDGNALVSGALYFNSSANEMRVYDGANWIAASSAGTASLLEYKYTATAGQTTFSGSDDASNTLSYTVDNLIVTLNGVVLENGTDYTATSGTSIVLASGAAVSDELNVIAFKSFTTADMVSKTNGGTFAGAVGFSGGATFPDSAELVFGTGSDFKISHNGSKTKIEDTGTGNLEIRGTNIEFYSGDGGETLAKLTDDGAAELYHNNTKRIETSSTGVDITGSVTADGLTVDQGSGGQGISLQRSGYDTMDIELSESGFRIRNETDGRTDLFIDGSGNLLVGKTATGTANDGLQVKPSGEVAVTRDANHSLILNRKTSDGNIALFQKDGSTVGSLASKDGEITVGSGDVGLRFYAAGDAVIPVTATNQQVRDNAIDLGGGSFRFKDLYLSGGAYIGGTGSANALDDYEEGTFTATLNGGSNHPSSRLQTTGQYTKVGNKVTVSFEFNNVTTTGSPNYAGHISVFGMPFAASDPSGTVRQVSGSVASYSMATWDSASSGLFARLGDGATEWYFYANRSNDAWYPLQHSPGTNRYLLFNATYITG